MIGFIIGIILIIILFVFCAMQISRHENEREENYENTKEISR